MRIINVPKGEKTFKNFEIKINGKKAEAFFARVSAMPFNRVWPGHQRDISQTEEQGFVSFTMTEAVEVELIADRDFSDVAIRPLYDNIKPIIDGRKISFTIEKCGQYTVEVDGIHNVLYLFANPEKDFGITPDTPNVKYFSSGVHKEGLIELESNQTLYLEEGAVVYGSVRAIKAENIKILGYGVLDGSLDIRTDDTLLVVKDLERRNAVIEDAFSPSVKKIDPADINNIKKTSILKTKEQFEEFLKESNASLGIIHLYGCNNVIIDGPVLRDSSGFTLIEANCENAVCDNVKLIGMWRYNSDGIDLFNSRNCVIKNSFLRNFDDCVVLKGIPGWDEWNMENILVENCVLWCDWGGTLEIGAETVSDEYKNIIFRDCDCIHNSFDVMRIHNCDRANVHHILYENIRAEYSKYDPAPIYQAEEDQKFEFKRQIANVMCIFFDNNNFYSNARVKGHVSDVLYKDIKIYTDDENLLPGVVLEGYDNEHIINNVKFQNVQFMDKLNIRRNEFCKNVKIGEKEI